MGKQKRPRPKHLAGKLKAIRLALGLSQPEMAEKLSRIPSAPDGAMISRYERGIREPSLVGILAYGKAGGISTNLLLDDKVTIAEFKKYLKTKNDSGESR